MNFEDEEIREVLQKTLKANLAKMDSADIICFKKMSDNLSLKPLKNKKAIGVIIYFEVNKKHTLDVVNKKVEAIIKSLPQDVNAVFAANKGNSKRMTTTTIYLY